MKNYCFLILLLVFGVKPVFAAVIPGDSTVQQPANVFKTSMLTQLAHFQKIPVLQSRLGQKLKLKLIKSRYFKTLLSTIDDAPTEKQKKQGKAAMIIGLASILLLLIPYIGVVSIPAAIVAIVLGAKSIKGNSNTPGIIGIIAGGVTLFLIILAIIYATLLFGG